MHGRGTNRRRIDAVIAEFAARQNGIVARVQLLAAGVSPHAIDQRVKSGLLRVLHRGVYQVGPAAPFGMQMAAVLASGMSARVSHRSAAGMWELLPDTPSSVVDVTVTGRDPGQRPGVRLHRLREGSADEATILKGVPVTTMARTVLDIATTVSDRELERAAARAERAGVAAAMLVATAHRHARHPGARRLRRFVEAGAAFTRSEAEERLLELVRRARLTAPATNCMTHGYEVDFFWRDERLVVEVDGFAYHSSRAAFERDRRRDAVLAAAGMRVVRLTWRQIVEDSASTIAQLAQALVR
jgi:very-short-patch-repair endonuclease